MNNTDAAQLARRLGDALPSNVRTEPVQMNPHAGDLGWVVRVHRPDGTSVDVFGSDRSGFQITSRALGWQTLNELAAELITPTDAQVVETPSVSDRLTEVASLLRRASDELAAIRDTVRMSQ